MLLYPSLVLVQPRMIRLCLTERLLMGRKIQIKQKNLGMLVSEIKIFLCFHCISLCKTCDP